MTFVDFRTLNHSGFGLIHLEWSSVHRLDWPVIFFSCTLLVGVWYQSRPAFGEGGRKELFLFLLF